MQGAPFVPLFQVDAFTARPFAGNPAAVCLLQSAADPEWMSRVAAEMNLSETAFVLPSDDGFDLRWFTPAVEVDLCGHATLAAAHVLWETGAVAAGHLLRFHTRSGLLTARRLDGWIELDFPATPPEAVSPPDGLEQALGAAIIAFARTPFDYLAEVADEATVRSLAPDLRRIRDLPVRGLIVTSRSSMTGVDFVSRFFAPAAGIDEDPVTGSAHCALGPYWSAPLGKSVFAARQLSARGGELQVELAGDRVLLRGHAVTVLTGQVLR